MRKVVRSLSLVALLGGASCGLFKAAPPPSPPRQTQLDLHIEQFELKNGLRVAVVTDRNAAEVTVTTRYRVGSIDDPPGREGMAHLAEHLMFAQDWQGETLEARLARFASYSNAMTTYDATTFVTRVAPAQLADALGIEGARLALRCQGISDEVFARERAVIENERVDRQEAATLRGPLHRALFGDAHPYQRLIGGTAESIAAITKPELCAFLDAHYSPASAAVVVSGPVTTTDVDAALAKLLGRLPARATRRAVRAVGQVQAGGRVEIPGDLDEELVVLAWPLSLDPTVRVRMEAVAQVMVDRFNALAKGLATTMEFGDDEASALAIVIDPADDERPSDAIDVAERAVTGTLQWLEEAHSDYIRQVALHVVFRRLEEGSDRDARLAAFLAAGLAPAQAVGAELQGINRLDRNEMRAVGRQHLLWSAVRTVVIKPAAKGGGAGEVLGKARRTLASAVGMIDPVRVLPPVGDPTEASRPAQVPVELAAPAHPLRRATQRTLANGVDVILLPSSSTPTVDVRVIVDAGTADDPDGRRGLAGLTAYQLYGGRDIAVSQATGAVVDTQVATDHTTFSVRGLGMYVDVYLSALGRLLREGGMWEGGVDAHVAAMRRSLTEDRDDKLDGLIDAWTASLVGPGHPYASRGRAHHLDPDGLDLAAAKAFRRDRYRPDATTIIIAGGFDAALAERWIDHLFAGWNGAATTRPAPPRARPRPLALSWADEKETRLNLLLAWSLPARRTTLAADLVAAEMVRAALAQVRSTLGATYGLSVELIDRRLARSIEASGNIDPARAQEALALVRARLDELATPGPATALAFVAARRRVLAELRAVSTASGAMADQLEHAVARGGDLRTELALVDEVARLTLDQVGTLRQLTPAQASVAAVGPKQALDAAAAALGLTWHTP